MSDEVPNGRSDWARLERRHRVAVIAFAAALVVALGAGGAAWWAARRTVPGGTGSGAVLVEPVPEETSSAEPATSSAATSTVATASASATGGTKAASAAATGSARAALVAFRVEGALMVAREDGTGETKILDDAPAAYSLSPDGKTVAAVDAGRGELLLVDVASRSVKKVPDAVAGAAPSWAPDSSRVYFTGGKPTVHAQRVGRDGSGSQLVAKEASSPKVSPDGKSVAYLLPRSPSDNILLVRRLSESAAARVAEGVSAFAWADSRSVFYSTMPRMKPSELHVVRVDRSGDTVLDGYSGERPAAFTDLCVAPGGASLVYAETGDDGYSRMVTIRRDGTRRRSLSVRRDTYPRCWTADGQRILFIEGNSIQGEPTALMSVLPDGMGRRTLFPGADR